ncbi:hypothetical protein ACOMICROBIO_NCLOACGD_04056 [Vibrio sp. B1ASS3]|uniref:hypothetical protein n=1 Tax=Vibrio sp. B1ASS3 TaxID=2751176 RepID=UPI001ABB2321|nr:hypothetical protein [Vibrio sp. B1ASS3]CAD7821824.1 hypothetical protein ACOMICROBIO_NCLOACGD_04056 [Vibrio sp. B1ASS3]CAE6946051.1 hypothetical protein ACOMICROBIO_NCLOACGD_04056 [Vibrio sp. B1ASS3]
MKKSLISICILCSFASGAYAEVTINEQTKDALYDSSNTFKPNGEILLRDTGVSYSSDNDIALVTLDGKALTEEIVLTNGEHHIQLNVWDLTGNHKSSFIDYSVEDIDFPVNIINQGEYPTFTLNANVPALVFADTYMEIDAKDGLIYANIDGSQYADTTTLGYHSGMLRVVDINGDEAKMEISYTVN